MKVLPVIGGQEKALLFWQELQALGVKKEKKEVDYILVLGGDGTFLGAVRQYYNLGKPFLGIGMGSVNFLLNQGINNVGLLLEKMKNNQFNSFSLGLLEARIKTRVGEFKGIAFNDIFIKAIDPTGTVDLEVYTREHKAIKVKGDGLIVATAQGSTVYNRNAGGTILPLLSHLWCLTGICTREDLRVVIEPQEILIRNLKREAVLVTDNEKFFGLEEVVIKQSKHQVQIYFQKEENFEQRRYKR